MAAIFRTIRAPGVGRLLAVFGAFRAAEFGVWISMTTVAFGFGGVREATAVLVAQLLPAAFFAAFVGGWSDRRGARRVLTTGLIVQSAAMFAIAVALATGAPHVLAYAGAVISTCAVTTTRPVVATLLPAYVRGPRELAAANVALGWLDGAATLVGPAIAALTLTSVDSWTPFTVFGVLIAVAAIVTLGLPDRPTAMALEFPGTTAVAEPPPVRAALGEVAHAPGPRSVLLLLAARAFSDGALDLIYVVVAVEVLHGSSADAGWLYTMFGAGALVGAAASMVLVGRRSLWPAALDRRDRHRRRARGSRRGALGRRGRVRVRRHRCRERAAAHRESHAAATRHRPAPAVPRVLARGSERHDDAHVRQPQRAAHRRDPVATMGGRGRRARARVVVVGSQIGAVARADRRANAPIEIIELLRHSDIFGLLSAPALETLAREARPFAAPAGTVIITEGDRGDDFYVVQSGAVAITHDGQVLRTCRRGHGFGELALLFDVPRTATVTTTEDSELLAIGREAFLVSVTGEQATVHNLAAHIDALDHSLGAWPGPEPQDQG